MTSFSRTSLRLFPLIALPLLAASLPAGAAAVRHARVPATAAKPAAANNAVIALPLQPVVPATQRLCAARTPAGLGYTMLRAGSGARPSADATVLVNYIGYLAATGAVFDQGMRSPLPIGGVISGFSQGMQMLAKSGVVRLCIPAAMGYGAQASGPIPANSDLVFQVELLDFKSAAEIAEMRKARAAEEGAAPKEGASPKDVPPQR